MFARAGIAVYRYSFYCGEPEDQSIERDLGDIRNLGIIFDAQDQANALIKRIERQIATTREALTGREIRGTPAGKAGRKIAPIPSFFGMPIRDGAHVDAVARVLHPDAF